MQAPSPEQKVPVRACALLAQIRFFTAHEQSPISNLEAAAMQCRVCHRGRRELDHGLQTCATCKQVVYCGKSCQKKDWKRHKIEHAALDQANEVEHETFAVQVAGALGGNAFVIQGCAPTTTVRQLKQQIVQHNMLPSLGEGDELEWFQIDLFVASQILLDEASLSDAGVAEGSCLTWIGEDRCPPPVDSSDDEYAPRFVAGGGR